MEYYNTMLQYYLHIPDPAALPNDLWALKVKQIQHIRNAESKAKK